MSQYVTWDEWTGSPYGVDYAPATGEMFESSGQIEQFLTYVSAMIDSYCGRSFGVQEYVEEYEGNDEYFLYLNVIPVTGVVSILYSRLSGSSGYVTEYSLNKKIGKIKQTSRFDSDYTYTVTYHAGYETIPDTIKLATLMWANIHAQAIANEALAHADGGSVAEFRFNKIWEGYSDPRHREIKGGVPPAVEAILKRFKYLR